MKLRSCAWMRCDFSECSNSIRRPPNRWATSSPPGWRLSTRAHAGSPPISDYKRGSMQNARTSFDASFRSREICHDLMAKTAKQGTANPEYHSADHAHRIRRRKSEPHGAPHWLAPQTDPELADDRIESVAQVPT